MIVQMLQCSEIKKLGITPRNQFNCKNIFKKNTYATTK